MVISEVRREQVAPSYYLRYIIIPLPSYQLLPNVVLAVSNNSMTFKSSCYINQCSSVAVVASFKSSITSLIYKQKLQSTLS